MRSNGRQAQGYLRGITIMKSLNGYLCASLALAFGALAAEPAAAVTPVYDYSFEDSNVPTGGYYYASGFQSWSGGNVVSDAGVTFNGMSGVQSNGSAWGFAAAPDGSYTAFIQSYQGDPTPGSITLDVSNLTSGRKYALSFSYAERPGYSIESFSVSGAATLGPIAPTSTSWKSMTTTFTAGAANTITFTGANETDAYYDADVGLDHVSISSVPEASTWVMLLLGFAGLGFAARRRPSISAA